MAMQRRACRSLSFWPHGMWLVGDRRVRASGTRRTRRLQRFMPRGPLGFGLMLKLPRWIAIHTLRPLRHHRADMSQGGTSTRHWPSGQRFTTTVAVLARRHPVR